MSQTAVNKAGQPIAFPGLVSANTEGEQVDSAFSAEASAEIGFGLGVKPGTALRSFLLPTATSSVIRGITKWGANHEPGSTGDLGTTGLKPLAGGQLVRKGRIWVVLDANVTIVPWVDRAYCRATANTGTVIGSFSNADDSGHMVDIRKQAIFISLAQLAADGTTYIAELEVDFTNSP